MPEPYPPPPKSAVSERFQQFGSHEILLLVALGGGLVGYLIGFFNEMARANLTGLAGAASLLAALLAGTRLLPRSAEQAGNANTALVSTGYVAAPLAVYAALTQLQTMLGGGAIGTAIVLLVLTGLQAAALVLVLLSDLGVYVLSTDTVKKSEPNQAPPPPFAPPGQFQQGSGWNTPGKPVPGHFGQSPAGSAVPASGWSPNSGGQPAPPASGQQGQPQQGQPQQGQPQQGQPGGPQGTQQMPHPGN